MKNENKLIAEFMGMTNNVPNDNSIMIFKTSQGNEVIPIEELKYDTDWNELMPVVGKCFDIADDYNDDDMHFKLNDALLLTNIGMLYKAVVEFIKSYNEENQLNKNDMKTKNKLIVEFMELPTEVFKQSKTRHYFVTEFNSGSWYEEEELSYNVSWDWLMPVVYKIKWLEDLEEECYEDIDNGLTNALLPQTYDAVLEFINKYVEE